MLDPLRQQTGGTPSATLRALLVGKPRSWGDLRPGDADAPRLATAIAKREVAGPVWLGPEGLEGDAQGNRRVHGGPDKAVCCYSADHFPAWRTEDPALDFAPGAFGENFSLAGIDEARVCIGDRWRVGDAVVEVSQPRQPCATLARYWCRPDLPKLVTKSRRTGWYLRVIEEGAVTSGDTLELLARPEAEWTIDRVNVVTLHEKGPSEDAARLHDVASLSEAWREQLAKRLR
jgi:MOSC domain-containing protein YiiM